MKKYRIFAAIAAAACVSAVFTARTIYEQKNIAEKVIRIHIRANSDSYEDQALKLEVRDELICTLTKLLKNCESRGEAEHVIGENLEELRKTAEKITEKRGYYTGISLGKEIFPEKRYEDFSLPAGEYLALCINMGSAKGKNWWCVAYPPLCLSAVSDKEAVFSQGELKFIEDGGIKIKFKLLEAAAYLKKLIG